MASTTRTCATVGCSNDASLQCPTCLKLGITEGSFFCNQVCFKNSWSTHKAIHKSTTEGIPHPSYPFHFPWEPNFYLMIPNVDPGLQPITWPGFAYSGPQRAYPQVRFTARKKNIAIGADEMWSFSPLPEQYQKKFQDQIMPKLATQYLKKRTSTSFGP
jgi:hypothetical protein